MTLMISTLRRMDVVVTADGRSIEKRGDVVTAIRDTTQKLFAVNDQPIVIGQYGQNIFEGHPVLEIVRQFATRLIPGLPVVGIADRLREALHGEVRETLRQLPPGIAAGCWVVGFGRGEDEPEHADLFWKFEEDQFVLRENHWRPVDIILAGDGKKDLHPAIEEVESASVETVRALHGKLYAIALAADLHPNSVGGHIHELVIRPRGWEWTIAPAAG